MRDHLPARLASGWVRLDECVQETGRIISELKAKGLAIMLIEQNLSLALAVADYVFVIENGTIVHESTVEEFRGNLEVRARYLGID